MDNALKAVIKAPYELVVENHIVLFGGRDLTGHVHGENRDGSLGEYFSKNVDLESDYTKTGRLLVDFEHGQDPDKIGNTRDDVLGYVDWKTAKITDEGVIVRRVLNRRHAYMKWLEPLIEAGVIGTSSVGVSKSIIRQDDGGITRWPLKRDTLTITPMEPRMLGTNVVAAMKALAKDIPFYKPDAALSEGETDNKKSKKEDFEMDENDVKSLVADTVKGVLEARDKADAEKAALEAERVKEIEAAAEEAYKNGVEDTKKAIPTKYHTTEPFDDDNDGVGAFKAWMQVGDVNEGLIVPDSSWDAKAANMGKAAWNVTTGASGGYLVPDPLYDKIVAKRNIASWVRQQPVQHFSTPAEHLLIPRESTSLTDFVLTAEAASYDEEEGTVSQKDLYQYKYTKLTKVSEEFLMYNQTNWDSWFAETLGRAVAGTENAIFTTGDASGNPEGIVTGATVANTTATTDTILPSELTALIGYLNAGYNVQSECGFLMNNTTKWYLAGDTGDSWQYFNGGMAGGPALETLFGYKVTVDDDVVVYTTASAKCVVFGNMHYYAVLEKPGLVVQRNPYLYMATGQVGIFASMFRGGGVLQGEAFYYLTNHA